MQHYNLPVGHEDHFGFHSIFQNGKIPELCWIYTMDNDLNWEHPMHCYSDISVLAFVTEGVNEVAMENNRFYAHSGDILIFNSGQMRHERALMGGPISQISFGIRNVNTLLFPHDVILPFHGSPVIPTGEYRPMIQPLIELIVREVADRAPNYLSTCHDFLGTIFSILIRYLYTEIQSHSTEPEEDHIIGAQVAYQAKEYIDAHYRENISLKDLARDLHFNMHYISHAFKNVLKYSPMQYMTYRRLGEAHMLLLQTDMPISDIAKHVGYENVNNFFIQFKKAKGVSPSAFRLSSR